MRLAWILLALATPSLAQGTPPFAIHVVDAATGRGVPMVELEATSHLVWVTDSNGFAAIDEPELEGTSAFFHIRSHGYTFPKDRFGYAGARCLVRRGTTKKVKLGRNNIAERLYRLTGSGIYSDSVKLGRAVPTKNAVRNGGVFGQDSVVNAIYKGKLFWFWGDTNRASYPLGNFAVSGATSLLPKDGGLPPDRGVDLTYFVNKRGFSRPMCKIEGRGPVWIFGLMVVEHEGKERMLTHFSRMKNLGTRLEHGIVVYDDAQERFVKTKVFPLASNLHPGGNPVRVGEWFYFPNPYPTARVRARYEDILDVDMYEAFGYHDGAWRWKGGTRKRSARRPQKLPKGIQNWMGLRDVETGKAIKGHGGTIHWNAHRKKWVMIALETFGRSMLGEVWFAEADTLMGPWGYARRIVTHKSYSFYNVKQHPYFDEDGGRRIYFEGTYTAMFSGAKTKTPRYDYNQIMYRLDLDDERLKLPVPVYEVEGEAGTLDGPTVTRRKLWSKVRHTPYWMMRGRGASLQNAEKPLPAQVRLYVWRDDQGRPRLRTLLDPPGEGWKREAKPAFYAWPAPTTHPPVMETPR
jgi:hypothetical protein